MSLESFYSQPDYVLSFILFFVVACTKWVASFWLNDDLMAWFRFYCDRLANKVNKTDNSHSQQKLSGAIAILMTLAPLLIILWLFEAFIEVVWLWHGLMLYVSLGSLGMTHKGKSLVTYLKNNDTYQAKQIVKPLLLRDSSKLSSIGIAKAYIESALLRTLGQYVVVGFYFLLLGPLAALTTRLLLEMHYSWNRKNKQFLFFGHYAEQLINIIQWLPVRLFTFILLLGSLGNNFMLHWHLIRRYMFVLNNSIAVYCLALSLEKKLGGVAMYAGEKVRRQEFNTQGRQPEPHDIIKANQRINQVLYFVSVLLFFTTVMLLFINITR